MINVISKIIGSRWRAVGITEFDFEFIVEFWIGDFQKLCWAKIIKSERQEKDVTTLWSWKKPKILLNEPPVDDKYFPETLEGDDLTQVKFLLEDALNDQVTLIDIWQN